MEDKSNNNNTNTVVPTCNKITSQLKELEELNDYINKQVNISVASKKIDDYESEKTDLIATALSKAQGEFKAVSANRRNNYLFRQYSDLDAIVESVREALAKNGLSITFQQKLVDDRTILVTKLRHESSQYIETRARVIPAKNDLQTYASALKALKRHSLMSLLNITIQGDLDDDDAETDMKTVRLEKTKGTGINTRYAAKEESFQTLSKHEADELQYMLSNYPDIAEQILDTLSVEAITDIPKSKFVSVIEQAREIIHIREGRGRKNKQDNHDG